MKSLYSNVNDIDLWTAGVSELPLRDAMLGPTHASESLFWVLFLV